jgi:mono/diheme cytochrome c family protein
MQTKKMIVAVVVILTALCSKAITLPQQVSKNSVARGKKVYEAYCSACHQADGGGVPRMNPTLIKTKWVLGSKTQLISIIVKGLKGGEIEIDGDEYHNPMPAQTQLTDQQIADVLTYVRNSFGNNASAITLAEVKEVKARLSTK